ncbi:cyclin-dependent kinase-like 2 isoform X2 [Hypanus sabinus]|uniref:cyclin-dependent kinase-like 2 isoform X2 n=1 Tax=Hypanus sabinus TaxID=79690 RepID=UPI0028C4845B|nr:cyclin-dependent kinase-like 2 isoform X2 [Hypanus sabinus]
MGTAAPRSSIGLDRQSHRRFTFISRFHWLTLPRALPLAQRVTVLGAASESPKSPFLSRRWNQPQCPADWAGRGSAAAISGSGVRCEAPLESRNSDRGGRRRTLRKMDKYEYLGVLGEGSYGMVTKCRNKENGKIVAVKKFLEGDDDKFVKKIAMREIRLLKRLRHENLVSLLEVFKKKGRWFLVFEYMDRTLLDDLEQFPKGLDYARVRSYLLQILRGLAFCHSHNIIHRDIKLENILVSDGSVLKLCDFGFARTLAAPGEAHTEYVATRWYRAPELLVGDSTYGSLIPRHQELFYKNPLFAGLHLPIITETKLLEERYPKIPPMVIDLVKKCLHIDPNKRSSCTELMEHEYFTKDGFPDRLAQDLETRTLQDWKGNLPIPNKSKTGKKDMEEVMESQKSFEVDSKVEDAEPKTGDGKPDSKDLRNKASQAGCEKVATLERAQDALSQDAGCCGSTCVQNTQKLISPGLGKEPTSSNYQKSLAVVIVPPISQGHPSALRLARSPWTGASGPPNFWSNGKMKRHKNLQGSLQQLPHARPIDLLLNSQSQLQHKKADRYAQPERMGESGRKQREAWRSEMERIHFPDLSSRCHIAEPISTEARCSRVRRDPCKHRESKTPSLEAVELIHLPSRPT